MHAQWPPERMPGIDRGLYAPDATEATYRRVCTLARGVVAAGYLAIVDATFLKRWQRDLFRQLASELQVPFAIMSFAASEATLRDRIVRRATEGHDASDADLAVLEHQLRVQEPLAPEECANAVTYDREAPLERAREPASWRAVVERLATASRGIADCNALALADPAWGGSRVPVTAGKLPRADQPGRDGGNAPVMGVSNRSARPETQETGPLAGRRLHYRGCATSQLRRRASAQSPALG